MIYLPMRIYLGKIPLERIPAELGKGVLWIAFLVLLYRRLWARGMRKYVSMGD
jgi:ABC-type uncharacterized transport system permease subunit